MTMREENPEATPENPQDNAPPPPPPGRTSRSVAFGNPSANKKWFLFGGIGGGIVLLAIVAAVVLTQVLGGRQGAADSMLTLTPPENIEYGSRLDIAAIARDEDFQDITGLDLNAEGVLEDWVGSLEVDPALIAGVLAVNPVEGEWNRERLNILEGDFEFADLRADLEDLEYEETSYREYEVWEDRGGRDYYALVGEGQYVLYSESEDAVKAALNSLYREVSLANAEDSDLKRVLDKVGNAPQVWFFNEDRCGIGRCRGYGVAFGGYDATAQEIPASFVLLFSSPQAAGRAADEYDEVAAFVEEGIRFAGGAIDIADIASDGEFVVGSGKYNNLPTGTPAQAAATADALLTMTPPEIANGVRSDVPAIIRDEGFLELTGLEPETWSGPLKIDPALLSGVLSVQSVADEWDGEPLSILEGNFEFADLRADLEDLGYDETSYREYEVWEDRDGWDYYALLAEGQYVLYSESEDAVKAGLNSLYREVSLASAEDSNLKRVMAKVGSALRVWFLNEDWCTVGRCLGYGVAFGSYDAVAEEIPVNFVLLFSSDQAAERAADEYDEVATFVEEDIRFEGGAIDIAGIASDGEFVVGSGKYNR